MATPSRPTSDVSRRTLVRTAGWSVPVVAVSVAAPAFAASAMWRLGGSVSYSLLSQIYTAPLTFQPGSPTTAALSLTFTLTGGAVWRGGAASWGFPVPTGWSATRTSNVVLTYAYTGPMPPANATFRPDRDPYFGATRVLTIRLLVNGVQSGSPITHTT
jgi:hypothetical protein